MTPWLFALIPIVIVVILGTIAFFIGYRGHLSDRPGGKSAAPAPVESRRVPHAGVVPVMREDSRITSQAPDQRAVLVQFLDAESESCRAVHSFVEQLKQDFGRTVTFATRHFPLSDQSFTAALALEAAGEQGKFNELLEAIYAVPRQVRDGADAVKSARSGRNGESAARTFRGLVEDLGLDMASFDAALTDPRTMRRVKTGKIDGAALGISSPPSFFLLDGKEVQATTLAEFRQMIADAAAR
ncbi:DsbA family protein [Arthrobacter sp. H14]|uniref:DsbA family protein n=1 Tax=Arthrobacter sp. H14 TaxID=1312959 RepID=UPI0004BC5C04|nr:thioredoxin domain-containing protein [Arthrobacter sp. H14]